MASGHAFSEPSARGVLTAGVGVLWISFLYSEMDPTDWETQQTWIQGCMYAKVSATGAVETSSCAYSMLNFFFDT